MEIYRGDISFGKTKTLVKKDEITFNQDHPKVQEVFAKQLEENELVELVNCNKRVSVSFTSFNANDQDKVAIFSKKLYRYLSNLDNDDTIQLSQIEHRHKEAMIADVDDIKKGKAYISSSLIQELTAGSDKELAGILIVNRLNGYQLQLDNHEFELDDDIKTVRLNAKHRQLLDYELPTYITQAFLDYFQENFQESYQECGIGQRYPSESDNIYLKVDKDNILNSEDFYKAKGQFRSFIKANKIKRLAIYPIYKEGSESFWQRINNLTSSAVEFILDKFIRNKQVQLRAVRPYSIDETENVARLSETTMKVLGVEETDNVVIKYGDSHYKARVLELDNYQALATENRIKFEQELSTIIGIPSHIRDELGLDYINYTVNVERDLPYLFKKHLNKQLLTMVGVLLSLNFLQFIDSYLFRAAVVTFITIIMVYFSFSEVREKISNK